MANEKFSQFAAGGNILPGDIVVGLRAGVNTQFTSSNSVNNTVYEPVRLVSTTTLNASYNNGSSGVGATLTANVNGALIVDGFPANLGDRILVAGQLSSVDDGIYTVTQTGSSGTPYILTRATDFDTPSKIVEGGFVTVSDGFEYGSSIWVVLQPTPIVIGSNNIILESTLELALNRFAFLQSANNLLDVASPISAFDNISPVNTKGSLLGFNGTVSAELSPGINGQVLTADNTQTLGFKWNTPSSGFAFTSKGQLITYDGTNVQYENVGTDTFVLTADSTQPNGIKWAASSSGLNFTSKGQLVTYDGTTVQYLGVGTDGFVLTADSTQPDGLNWIAAPPPSFTYPYTFTGNNVIFSFTPTMSWATANCLIYSNASKNLATTPFLKYYDSNNQLIQDTASASVTAQNVAVLSSTVSSIGANYTFIAATNTGSIASANSAIVASTSSSIDPLGSDNFIAGSNVAYINNTGIQCIILGNVDSTIGAGSSSSGVICSDNASITATESVVIGGTSHSITGTANVILGGNTNAMTSGVNSVIAGGSNNTANGDHNFIAASNNTTANNAACALFGDSITSSTYHSFMFSDGTVAKSLVVPNSFNIFASRGVAVGGVNPNVGCSIELQENNKALRLNNVAGVSVITSPFSGQVLFDTTTNQCMLYNGSAWVITG